MSTFCIYLKLVSRTSLSITLQTLFAAAGGRKRKRGQEVVIEEEDLVGCCVGDDDDENSDKEVNPEEVHGLVSMRNITKLVKRPHSTKADRMDTVAEGREGHKKYGFQVGYQLVQGESITVIDSHIRLFHTSASA